MQETQREGLCSCGDHRCGTRRCGGCSGGCGIHFLFNLLGLLDRCSGLDRCGRGSSGGLSGQIASCRDLGCDSGRSVFGLCGLSLSGDVLISSRTRTNHCQQAHLGSRSKLGLLLALLLIRRDQAKDLSGQPARKLSLLLGVLLLLLGLLLSCRLLHLNGISRSGSDRCGFLSW